MTELERYLEENDYSEWTEAAWLKAEADWGTFPEESEEYRKLRVLRKQRERKLADEEAYRNFLIWQEQRARNLENGKKFSELSQFKSLEMKAKFEDAIQVTNGETFPDVYEDLKKKKNISSDYEVCKKSNLTRDIISRLKKNRKYIVNRDILWALALGMGLNMDEARRLFKSCGLNFDEGFNFTPFNRKRENAIRFFIENHMSLEEANEELENYNLGLPLGNVNTSH